MRCARRWNTHRRCWRGLEMARIDFKQVAEAARNALDGLVSSWLIDGRCDGHEWVARNPTRSDAKSGSFKVNLRTGAWADFATDDKGGDAISLYAYLFGGSQLEAAQAVADQLGMNTTAPTPVQRVAVVKTASKPRSEWSPIVPVPADAPVPPVAHLVRGKPAATWTYRTASGELAGFIWRFVTSDGGKEILPVTFCQHAETGAREWRWVGLPDPRPLYVPGEWREGAVKLVVEGEKCADVAHITLPEYDAVTWAGGSKAVDKSDWSRFKAGDRVLLWPDCDAQNDKSGVMLPEARQPGVVAMEKIAQKLLAQGCKVRLVVIPAPGEKPSGWDIADALAEGMGADEIREFIKGHQRAPAPPESVSPAPLPTSETPAPETPNLTTLLAHYALIYGKTDIWDSLNRQLMKKAGFVALVGKDLAKTWLEHASRRTIDLDALPRLKRGKAVEGGGGDRVAELLQRFTLLYGTVTVWDHELRKVMTLEALRAAYSGDLIKRWQEHPARLLVDAENLVFDPTQQVSPDTHVNMFEGLPVHPRADDALCAPILDLLYELCSAEENCTEVAHWILCWIAYQLQHPGAKMQTAILMFGEKQGTGKSLFWEGIVRPIFGEYGTTAGQHQLDSQFTEWRSRKLFVLFEEVLSRSDRYNHLGTIKHMITGRDMRINPKGLPERVEANHLNCCFLSNEPQPIPLELEDRRFMVVEAKNFIQDAFKNEVVNSLKNGGIAAFYHHLLHYPLGDFDPHSKPIQTVARKKIVAFGLPSWEVFWREWKSGGLSVPFCACLSTDLYWVYRRWCDKTYEKPLTLTKFSCLLSNRETKARYEIDFGMKSSTCTIFITQNINKNEESLSKQCNRFRNAAGIKDE